MRYLLDFDETLFRARDFVAAVTADGRASELFTPAIWQHYTVADFFYQDTLPWLQSKPSEALHIITAITPRYGDKSGAFQRSKLATSGLSKLVQTITFLEGEKGPAAAEIAQQFPPHEPVVFVDDRIEQCLSVQAALPQATCCLMVRDPAQIGDVAYVRDMPVVHTLSGVDAIIEKTCR